MDAPLAVFYKVELQFLWKESGGFEDNMDGCNELRDG